MKVESAILAGGKNSRYGGQNKAFILVEGVQIIDRNIDVLKPIFPRISIITNHPEQFHAYADFPMNSDYYIEIGPLAGIHSALKNTKADGVFISSCDMPFLDSTIIERVLQKAKLTQAKAVIPRVNGEIEPLFAFYHSSILTSLEEHIKLGENRSIRSFLKKIGVEYVDMVDSAKVLKAFTNINRPEDLSSLNA